MVLKNSQKTKQKKMAFSFFLPSRKHGGWSLLLLLSLFEGRGLSYYPQKTFIDSVLFLAFTMCPYCSNGLYDSDSESALLKLGIPPVLERVEHKSFISSFVCCCQLSQTEY